MKKLILTFFACFMMVGLFAQKETIKNFVDGNISKDVFVKQLVGHFNSYEVTSEQRAKIQELAIEKAENYTVIAKMKTTDPELFKAKMKGQKQHYIDSMKFILDQKQYRKFMMEIRGEKNRKPDQED